MSNVKSQRKMQYKFSLTIALPKQVIHSVYFGNNLIVCKDITLYFFFFRFKRLVHVSENTERTLNTCKAFLVCKIQPYFSTQMLCMINDCTIHFLNLFSILYNMAHVYGLKIYYNFAISYLME